jgi:hypothetical protein
VHLDTPQCFSAEMYAADLHVPGASEELKVNVLEDLMCLFCGALGYLWLQWSW